MAPKDGKVDRLKRLWTDPEILCWISHPDVFFYKKDSATNERCCICLNDFEEGEEIVRLPCLHIFHKEEVGNRYNEYNIEHVLKINLRQVPH